MNLFVFIGRKRLRAYTIESPSADIFSDASHVSRSFAAIEPDRQAQCEPLVFAALSLRRDHTGRSPYFFADGLILFICFQRARMLAIGRVVRLTEAPLLP